MIDAEETGQFSQTASSGADPAFPRFGRVFDGAPARRENEPDTALSFDAALRAAVVLSAEAERLYQPGQVTLIPAAPMSYEEAFEAALTLAARVRRRLDPEGRIPSLPLFTHDEAMRVAVSLAARARIALEQGEEFDLALLRQPIESGGTIDPAAAAAKVAAQAARARLTRVREELKTGDIAPAQDKPKVIKPSALEVRKPKVEMPSNRLVVPPAPSGKPLQAEATPWHKALLDRARDRVLQAGEQIFRPHLVLTRHAEEIEGPRLADLRLRPAAQTWSRSRIALAQQIWGEGAVVPGGPDLIKSLMDPLGLKRKMNVLDLGMGLGGPARIMTKHYGVSVVGMEWDRGLVRSGRAISNRRYWRSRKISINPSGTTAGRIPLGAFDRFIAKDCLTSMPDKERVLRLLAEVLRVRGQLLFCDVVLTDPERRSTALDNWIAGIPESAEPWAAVDYIRLLTGLGLNMEVQDMTDQVLSAIAEGWAAFDDRIEEAGLDSSFTRALENEEAHWTRQIDLLESGELNYYRFHVAKRF